MPAPATPDRSYLPDGFGYSWAMLTTLKAVPLAAVAFVSAATFAQRAPTPTPVPRSTVGGPQYTGDGQLKFPERYREWVYLTTGFDMSYNPAMRMGHDMFDNVFVNPDAYEGFVRTGTWPDKTVLVLEVRGAQSKGSINQAGSYQSLEIMGREVHVKDEARFPGKWAFFAFDRGNTATMIPTNADCYSCHAEHGAVDTTFVQFYPTLLPIATSKGTLSASHK